MIMFKKLPVPDHPHTTQREPCGEKLARDVNVVGSKVTVHPSKIYAYRSLKSNLQDLLNVKGFEDLLINPKELPGSEYISDFCDGRIWKDFKDIDLSPYFENKRNLGLMLNLDWFNPYDNGEYSLGVIYAVIVNLIREERFKPENTIVFGVIPGPKESSLNINSYLEPIVDELLDIWHNGLTLQRPSGEPVMFKAVVMAASCDVPATRKLCGFLAHNALQGNYT